MIFVSNGACTLWQTKLRALFADYHTNNSQEVNKNQLGISSISLDVDLNSVFQNDSHVPYFPLLNPWSWHTKLPKEGPLCIIGYGILEEKL